MSAPALKCGRPSVLHQTALKTARLHPSGHQRHPRSLSLVGEIDLKRTRRQEKMIKDASASGGALSSEPSSG
ncbi:hypothetical protein ACLB2K_058948 [Fragaria x ananassa]